MQAVVLTDYGDVDKLSLREVSDPEPGPRDVLVKVVSASVNPVDWKLRRGELRSWMPLDLPTILGRDVAGEVVAVGAEVSRFKRGDRVLGLVEHGYAELVVAHEGAFALLPPHADLERAGGLPLVGLTGAQLIEEAVRPKSGERVIVTGALGAVGRVAVFVAKQHGAQVIVAVRAKQRESAEQLEVDDVVALDDPHDVARLRSVDAIADTVGGKSVLPLLEKVKSGGVVGTVVAPPLGAKEQGLQVHALLAHADSERLAQLGLALAQGELELPIKRVFALDQAAQAHQVAEAGGGGKVLLLPSLRRAS